MFGNPGAVLGAINPDLHSVDYQVFDLPVVYHRVLCLKVHGVMPRLIELKSLRSNLQFFGFTLQQKSEFLIPFLAFISGTKTRNWQIIHVICVWYSNLCLPYCPCLRSSVRRTPLLSRACVEASKSDPNWAKAATSRYWANSSFREATTYMKKRNGEINEAIWCPYMIKINII